MSRNEMGECDAAGEAGDSSGPAPGASAPEGLCPIHGDADACGEAFAALTGDFDGCTWFAQAVEYKPRVLKAPTQEYVSKILNKRKRAREVGEQRYESPTDTLFVEASWLKRIEDRTKLSRTAFSITARVVNHHINQHLRQTGRVIDRDLLEDLVIAELRILDVYGYEEWLQGEGPKKKAIAWDEVIEGVITSNLPDWRTMPADQAVLLKEEILQQIEEGAIEANRQREKGLEVRSAKKARRMESYVKYMEEHPSATVQMAAADLKLSQSTIEAYRRQLGLTRQKDVL